MAKSRKKLDKLTLHALISIIIFVTLKLLIPPVNGLTTIGVNVIAFFIAVVYLWISEGVGWVSLAAVVLFCCTGVMTYAQAFSASFGNWITIFMIVTMILNYALTDLGITRYIVVWSITRKWLEKKPWLFITIYFSAIYAVSLIMDSAPIALILLAITDELCEQFDCKEGEKLPKILFLGALAASLFGYMATPVAHIIPVVFIELISADFSPITFSDWCRIGIPTTIAMLVAMILLMRVIYRPDVSKVNNYDAEANRKALIPMTREQIIASTTYLLVIFFWLAPEFLKNLLPAVSSWLSNVGYCVPVIIAIIFLMLVKTDEGKPILDFDRAVSSVSWQVVFLSAVIPMIGAGLTSEAAGITAFITSVLGPVFQNFYSWVPLVLAAALWAMVQTNFMSCLVTGQMVYAIMAPLVIAMPQMGVSGIGVGIVIGMMCSLGIMTPPATGGAAIMLSTKWYTPKDGISYSIPIMIATSLLGTFVVYPLACIMF